MGLRQKTEWLTPAVTAQELQVSTRTLQNLEEKGFPSRGFRKTKRYKWPDCWEWYRIYRLRQDYARGAAIGFVDPVEALTEHARLTAISRAYWRLKYPRLYKNSEPLDREAKHQLDHARHLLRSGQGPPQLWEPEPRSLT